jgi:hypothetical protein
MMKQHYLIQNNRILVFKNILIFLPLLTVLLVITSVMNGRSKKPHFEVSKQQSAMNLSKDFVLFFNLGNRRFISGLLWIQTLIESDLEHYKQQDLNSWMFHRFDTITDLEPKFIDAFRFGSIYLSVIKDDVPGASYMYEKGLKIHPEDYFLNMQGGIHFFIEEYNYERAYTLLNKIKYHESAPAYLPSLVVKLKLQATGDLETTFKLMMISYEKAPENSSIKEKFKHDLYAIKAQMDLDCLNAKKSDCNYRDFDDNPYRKKADGTFEAIKTWKAFKLHKKEQ